MRKIWKVVHNRTKVSLAASGCALAGNGRDTFMCPITSDARGRGVPKHRRLPVRLYFAILALVFLVKILLFTKNQIVLKKGLSVRDTAAASQKYT